MVVYQHCVSLFKLLQAVYIYCSIWSIWPPSTNAVLLPYAYLQISYTHFIHFCLLCLYPPRPLLFLAVLLYLLHFLPPLMHSGFFNEMLKFYKSRSTELIRYISLHPVDLNCIQVFNLHSSSSFLISEYSAIRLHSLLVWHSFSQ